MPRRMSYAWIVLFLTITTLQCPLNFFTLSPVAGSDSEEVPKDPLIILVDQGHGQFFNASVGRFSQALAGVQLNNNTIVKFCNHQLNSSILGGVDVLIITNPSDDTDYEYAPAEEYALELWFKEGNKGLFLLSNPYLEDNDTLSGNSQQLENLITGSYLAITDVDIRKDKIRLDFPERSDTSLLSLDIDYNDHWIFNQSTGLVNKTITQSCSVEAPEKGLVAGTQAYIEKSDGSIDLEDENPEILSMTTFQNTSRLALCGSTIMFSDLSYNSSHSWYEMADNSILWQNVIAWLGGLTPIEEEEELSPSLDLEQLFIAIVLSAGVIFLIGAGLHLLGVMRPVSVTSTPSSTTLPTQRTQKQRSRSEKSIQTDDSSEIGTKVPRKTSRRQRQLGRQKKT